MRYTVLETSHWSSDLHVHEMTGGFTDRILSGNIKAFFARDCWDYRTEVARKYGRVSLLPAMLGVGELV